MQSQQIYKIVVAQYEIKQMQTQSFDEIILIISSIKLECS